MPRFPKKKKEIRRGSLETKNDSSFEEIREAASRFLSNWRGRRLREL